MSNRKRIEKQYKCDGKIKYKSIKRADNFIKDIKKKGHIVYLTSYLCEFCSGVHVGNKKNSVRKLLKILGGK